MKKSLLIITLCLIIQIANTQTLHIIEAGNFFYNPSSLTIEIGDTVRWVNVGGFHNVNAETNTITGENFNNPESFGSDPTSNSELLTRVFTVAGTYNYDCSVGTHAESGMVGSLTVEDNSTSTDDVFRNKFSSFAIQYLPSSELLEVSFEMNSIAENSTISVLSIDGRMLQEQRILTNQGLNKHQVNLQLDRSVSILLVALTIDGIIETKKLLIH
ncbi:MAG: plastocyanin/azurin family copper-binding protein [Bacteroidota bacterium]